MAPCSQDVLGFLSKKDQAWSLWTCVSLQMLMLEEWTKLTTSSLQDETCCSFPFLPNTSSARQHGLSQSKVDCLSVEEAASSKQQWVNAMVKEKKQDWPVSLVCSLHGERVTHALDAHFTPPCSCAASHMPTEPCCRAPRSLGSPSCSWSVTSHPAWLECGAMEQEKCWGVVQKETPALENLLKMYHLAPSYCQRASSSLTAKSECGISSSGIARSWGREVEVSPPCRSWSFRPAFSGFSPTPSAASACYVPRERSALAFIAPAVWVNRDSPLLTSVHKPYSLLKVSFR